MSLISTLPNFFNTVKPVAADFNNAAKEIASVIGGVYYDEALSRYNQKNGNIDQTNIISDGVNSVALFRNSQKAEPNGIWSSTVLAQVVAGVFVQRPKWGPFTHNFNLKEIHAHSNSFVYYCLGGSSGGSFVVYLNNIPLTVLRFTTICGTASDVASVAVDYDIHPGDFVYIDPHPDIDPLLFSNADRVQGIDPTLVAPPGDLAFTLFGKALHIIE